MNIYVGNLPYSLMEKSLEELFAEFGVVSSARIIIDRDTRRSKGFGFVEMDNREEAEEAISRLNDKEIDGRNIKVNEAKPREEHRF